MRRLYSGNSLDGVDLTVVNLDSFPGETSTEVLSDPHESEIFVDGFDSPGESRGRHDRLCAQHFGQSTNFPAIGVRSNNGVCRIEVSGFSRFKVLRTDAGQVFSRIELLLFRYKVHCPAETVKSNGIESASIRIAS